jgi:hypothetical protein
MQQIELFNKPKFNLAYAGQVMHSMGVDTETIRHALEWIKNNRDVWVAFEDKVLEAIERGDKYISSKGIFEDLRRDFQRRGSYKFKFSNSYTAYLARLFVAKYPEHQSKFKFCKTKGLKEARDV